MAAVAVAGVGVAALAVVSVAEVAASVEAAASAGAVVALVAEVHPVAGDLHSRPGQADASPGADTASAGRALPASHRGLMAWWRHSGLAPDPVLRAFDDAAFDRIEAAIGAGEARHRGEIRFALEPRLGWQALRRGLGARSRALQIFGEHRIWDTEENTGILIYLLTADHAVEIIADRLVSQRLPASIWQQACQCITRAAVPGGQPVEGVLAAIDLLTQALIEALPARPDGVNPNELDNRPIRL